MTVSPSPAMLLFAVAFIGWGDLYVYGMYSPASLRLVTFGCVALAVGALAGVRRSTRLDRVVPVALVALLVWQGITVVRATTYYGHGHALTYAHLASIALPTLGAVAVAATTDVREWAWRGIAVVFAIGAIAAIRSSPKPAIDVWYLIQHASDCVLHGCNPYTMHTPRSPGVTDSFNYLPMTAVLLAPVRAVFGDTRYGDATAMLLAAAAIRQVARGDGRRFAPLMLCVPGLFFAVEQAWNESLLVLLLAGVAWSRRWVLTAALLALALATKQHVWLLLPVAAVTLGIRTTAAAAGGSAVLIAPWLLADPHAFWRGTVTFLADLPARIDATTLWLHEPAALRTPLVLVALAAAYVLVWLACRGHRHRFLLGAALVLAAFDLFNKQSFFNQWLLVEWLAVAAVALELGRQGGVSIVGREV